MSEKTVLGLTPSEDFVDGRQQFYSPQDEVIRTLAREEGRSIAEAYRLDREEGCLNDARCDAPGIRLYFLDVDGWKGIIEAALKMSGVQYNIEIAQEAEESTADVLEEQKPKVYVIDLPDGVFLSSNQSSAEGVDIYARHKKSSTVPAVLPYIPDGLVILQTSPCRQSGFLRVEGYNGARKTYWHNPRYLWDGRSLPGVG